jgi:hypothetical protein
LLLACPLQPAVVRNDPAPGVSEAALLPESNLMRRLVALLSVGRIFVSNDLAVEVTVTERHYCSLYLDGMAHLVGFVQGFKLGALSSTYTYPQLFVHRSVRDTWE